MDWVAVQRFVNIDKISPHGIEELDSALISDFLSTHVVFLLLNQNLKQTRG